MLIVQGGLHHLPTLPESLAQTLEEMHRLTRKEGRLIVVEPWLTPFLRLVHWTLGVPLERCHPRKLEALASLIEYERNTYEQWLKQPELILDLSHKYFSPVHESLWAHPPDERKRSTVLAGAKFNFQFIPVTEQL